MDEDAKSASSVAFDTPVWSHRQSRLRWGAAAMFFAVAASFMTTALSLSMMLSSAQEWFANPRFWMTAWMAGFPALALANSVGLFAGVWLWLAPEATGQTSCDRAGRVISRAARAAAIFAAADAVLTVLRVLFPPVALGGHVLPLWVTLIFRILEWFSVLLAVPFAWWLWRTVSAVVRLRLPGWQHAALVLSWAWPVQLTASLLAAVLQNLFALSPAGANLGPPLPLSLRVSTDVSLCLLAMFLIIDITSLALLLALQVCYWTNCERAA